jgi:hypothetical protein
MTADADAGIVQWQTSSDGQSWETYDSEASLLPEFDITEAVLDIGCGAWAGPVAADPLCSFTHAFICGT